MVAIDYECRCPITADNGPMRHLSNCPCFNARRTEDAATERLERIVEEVRDSFDVEEHGFLPFVALDAVLRAWKEET